MWYMDCYRASRGKYVEDWLEACGNVISAIGDEDFSKVLSNSLNEIAAFDYTVVFGFLGSKTSERPL